MVRVVPTASSRAPLIQCGGNTWWTPGASSRRKSKLCQSTNGQGGDQRLICRFHGGASHENEGDVDGHSSSSKGDSDDSDDDSEDSLDGIYGDGGRLSDDTDARRQWSTRRRRYSSGLGLAELE